MNSPADTIKQLLTMQEVAERYGFTPDRSGYIQCPFHQGDNHGSLKIYPGTGGWHCFGCGAGGSVIDFTMKLFDIGFRQAVVRLSADFNLGLVNGPVSPGKRTVIMEERRKEAERRAAIEAETREKAAEYRYWWQVYKTFAPDEQSAAAGYLHPLFAESLKRLPMLEYRLDELLKEEGGRNGRRTETA